MQKAKCMIYFNKTIRLYCRRAACLFKINFYCIWVLFSPFAYGFEGYALAVRAGQNLFLSGPNITQVENYKTRLDQFINSSSFQNLTGSQKQKIRHYSNHAEKFIHISKYLDECEQRLEHPDRRKLISQVKAGVLSVNPCDRIQSLLTDSQIENLENLSLTAKKTLFSQRIKINSLQNTGRAVLKYKYQLGAAGELSENDIEKLTEELCSNTCSDKRKNNLKIYLKNWSEKTKQAVRNGALTKYSARSGIEEINKRSQSLEQALREIDEEKKKRNFSQREVERRYNLYTKKYFSFAGDILGALMLTDSMKEEIGSLINVEDIRRVTMDRGRTGRYRIQRPLHKPIVSSAESKFHTAVEEAVLKAKNFNQKVQNETNLQDLIKANPIAAGQGLVRSPDMVQYVCDEIINIAQTDDRNETIFNYAETALNILDTASLGLMVTGVGAIIGGTARAGTAAARAGAGVLRGAVVSGISASAVRAVVGGAGAFSLNEQRQELINSRIAEAKTSEDIERIQEIERKLSASRSHLIDAGLDFLPFGALNKLRKSGRLAQLNGKTPSLHNSLSADEKIIKLNEYLIQPRNKPVLDQLSAMSKNSSYGPARVESLLTAVSQMDPQVQQRLLESLGKADISSAEVRKLTDDLETSLSQCAA